MKKLTSTTLFWLWTIALSAQLNAVSSFGSNPGNLKMYTYIPNNMPSNAPLVLVLHGCTQTASSYASESDWNSLADTYGFYIIYAQQKSSNNSSECFNWFETGDISRGYGEAASLKNMTDYMKNNYSIDSDQVFVTGFSAGGAMTTVMLATYPDVFSGGAVMAGLPYKVATSSNQAFQAMFGNVNKSPNQHGNAVRNASNHSGPWPTVAVFHGTSDYTVYYMNQNEIMEQWTNVHGADQTADATDNAFDGNSVVSRKEYRNSSGDPVVVTYSINNMGHAIAIDPGNGTKQGGNTGSYATDVNFFSSYWAAKFFGLTGGDGGGGSLAAPTNLAASAISSSQINLSWTDNASNETTYLVKRSTSSGGTYTTIATLSANSTSYSDGSLAASTTYYYKVLASDGSNTAASSVASATTQSSGGGGGTIVTIEQLQGNSIFTYGNAHDMGQSFTAIADGQLVAIEAKLVYAISNSTLKIYAGNGVSGTPIYTQSGVSAGSGWQEITLTNPPTLVDNQTYTFQLTNASIRYHYSNVYNGGIMWYDNIAYTSFDVAFVVSISTGSGNRQLTSPTASSSLVRVYPNPAVSRLAIEAQPATTVELYSLHGGKVYEQTMKKSSLNVDVSTYKPGVYLLALQQGDQKHSRKLIIERNP
ncbi:extracellular catalytic domain type 1 short-chain-length polyhydroxyalkanoate depolymerase [Marinoscillum furvescens]|uniref:Poly(Hydroxyalkanoate) depolymerase family esterase n=1 Tax=Marinoscillum furvescens DSM 4134 TaxID=1122208 RepID=A0A3D9KZV1_MARFU|nr:PHB depolymerase family esterase [Marinoscillum furvescens]RED94942.1 poly(hydroxyalkanoate) depolymerase family esterase [Marinoscillum furvescens DSM 4134]